MKKFLFLVAALLMSGNALAAVRQSCRIDLTAAPQWSCMQDDGTACSASDAEVNHISWPGYNCGITYVNEDATDAAAWVQKTAQGGWEVPGDNTDDEGGQLLIGASNFAASNGQCLFSPGQAYYVKVTATIPDVSDYDVFLVGFRNDGTFTASGTIDDVADFAGGDPYTDFAFIQVTAGDFRTYTMDDDGTMTNTDVTTTAWADGESHTLLVKVSSAGAVTYFVDGTAMAGAVAFSFDQAATDLFVPTVIVAKGATASDTPPIFKLLECGLQ